jgi:hypothetical protein
MLRRARQRRSCRPTTHSPSRVRACASVAGKSLERSRGGGNVLGWNDEAIRPVADEVARGAHSIRKEER